MKKLVLLLTLIGLPLCVSAQTVTNKNVDIVLPASVDAQLQVFYDVDNYMRTNGIAPYTNGTPAWTSYKTFLAEKLSERANDAIATMSVANKTALNTQMDKLQLENADLYRRVMRKAYQDQ